MRCFVKRCYILLNTNQRTFIDRSARYFLYKIWCHIKGNDRHNYLVEIPVESLWGGPDVWGDWWCRKMPFTSRSLVQTWARLAVTWSCYCLTAAQWPTLSKGKQGDPNQHLLGWCPLPTQQTAAADSNCKHLRSFQQPEELYGHCSHRHWLQAGAAIHTHPGLERLTHPTFHKMFWLSEAAFQ